MTDDDPKLSRAESFYTTLIILVGVSVLGLIAVVLSLLQPEGDLAASAEPRPVLQAPITTRDLERAQLGRDIRDAILLLDAGEPGLTRRGGHRDTGRGWFFQTGGETYGVSIAQILEELGILRVPDDRRDGFDVLVHQCGQQFAVLVPSTVPSDPDDQRLWDASECSLAETLVWSGPVFVAMSGAS